MEYIEIKTKCTCSCHQSNNTIIHFMPCCDKDGYVKMYFPKNNEQQNEQDIQDTKQNN